MKKSFILFLSIFVTSTMLMERAFAGIHLAYNPNYTVSTINDTSSSDSAKLKYKGIGHEFEAGYSFNMLFIRVIPHLALSQTPLKPATSDSTLASTILGDQKYKMGRLGYGIRIDLGSTFYFKGGGAIFSLTENPAPSDNYHINGTGYFAEAGFAFNLVPFLSFTLGGRYELAEYKKYSNSADEGTLTNEVKQTNMTALIGIGLRL